GVTSASFTLCPSAARRGVAPPHEGDGDRNPFFNVEGEHFMRTRLVPFSLVGLIVVATAVPAQPQDPPPSPSAGIDHQAVACIVVAKYPKLKACFGGQVVEPRAYFHAEGVREWYWVRMVTDIKDAPEPYCRTGVLPKPTRHLINKHIEYYLEDV